MGKVIAVINQKGGVGKTTTAINLAACLGYKDKKVLLIDSDAQGNATSGLGIEKGTYEKSIYDCMTDYKNVHSAIIKTKYKNLSVLPSTHHLAGAEIELAYEEKREYFIKRFVDEIREEYDFILIDSPPALGLLTINILTASDTVLVPIQCEYYALEGLSQLTSSIKAIRQKLNKDLEIEGILATMFDGRTNLSIQVLDELKKYFGSKVYKTVIPRNVRLSEAPSYGEPIIKYDITSKGAESYLALSREVITNNTEKR